jgi:phenylalanyl-tRNA synthetase beta chain
MSLVPGLLQSIAYNQNRQAKSVRLFEMGRIYEKTETGYKETPVLTVVAWGDAEAESWESPKRSVDFFDMKRWISALLQRLDSGLSVDDAGIHAVSKAWLKKAEVKGQVVAVEIPLKKLLKAGRKSVKYQPVSKFFGMRRDLSLVVEESVPFAQLQQLVKQSKVKHLSDVKVFDVFEGAPLEAGKKSISLSFFFNRSDQTMLDADADKAMEKLMETFESNGALIRR